MAETLVFSLVPEAGKRVRFDALEAAIVQMRRMIRDLDVAVFRAEGVKRRRPWYVERLSSSNPTVALVTEEGSSPLGRRTDLTLLEGIREVAKGESDSPPAFFSEQELESLVALRRRVLTKDLHHIEIGGGANSDKVDVFPSIEDHVNRILRGSVEALGSLDGEMDAINVRYQPHFTIWESMTRLPVRCSFEMERIEEVKALLHKRVRVSGLVRYFPNGRPRSISRVELIKHLGPSPRPAGCPDYWASVPALAHAVDSVEYLAKRFGDP